MYYSGPFPQTFEQESGGKKVPKCESVKTLDTLKQNANKFSDIISFDRVAIVCMYI